MADERNPRFVTVGFDLNIIAAEMRMRVNDVPVFRPGTVIGGEAEIDTSFPLNPVLRKGRNTVQIDVRMLPGASTGMTPFFRIDVGHWDNMGGHSSFDGRPMALRMQVDLATPDADAPAVQRLTPVVEGQPLVNANEPTRSDGTGIGDSWATYSFQINVDVDLPPLAWMSGEVIDDTRKTRAELAAEMREVHAALGQGADAALEVLKPYVTRQAAAVGATPEEWYPLFLAGDLDDPDLTLVPFDIDGAEFATFGAGRLATFLPMPHRFEGTDGGMLTLQFYYWQDLNGHWQIIH
ncbi:hypothetical protein [Tateyamaria sp. SN6-1]|uniref:hypothetical protein n=1 Tax=Tateyamaria sp. SN6-1 TaxID=3092148 RepID=UPI0039F54D05